MAITVVRESHDAATRTAAATKRDERPSPPRTWARPNVVVAAASCSATTIALSNVLVTRRARREMPSLPERFGVRTTTGGCILVFCA
jgi:hypothetical protein